LLKHVSPLLASFRIVYAEALVWHAARDDALAHRFIPVDVVAFARRI
jgi:hypothetical protein